MSSKQAFSAYIYVYCLVARSSINVHATVHVYCIVICIGAHSGTRVRVLFESDFLTVFCCLICRCSFFVPPGVRLRSSADTVCRLKNQIKIYFASFRCNMTMRSEEPRFQSANISNMSNYSKVVQKHPSTL